MAGKKRVIKTKPSGLGKEYFEVLLEDMTGKIDLIAENTSTVLKLKPVIVKTATDVEIIKTDLGLIKGLLKRKVDTEEFEVLERRVSRLENRL